MSALFSLIKRNTKLFFKDKMMFFTSLITPLILLVLYVTFLANTFKDALVSNIPAMFSLSDSLINGFVAGQLISSILAVSCVTVAFCSNFLMVQDKINGTRKDLTISPVKSNTLSMSYYIASIISTFIVCITAMAICLVYASFVGWYFTVTDILLLILDVFILVLFGTALSSIVNLFLSSQGQISAVGTIVSAGYGFICGAYMPINSFGDGLQKVISFLPGTYGTALIRNHTMRGVFAQMQSDGLPIEVIDGIKKSIDCNLSFFNHDVSIQNMYIIMIVTVVVLIAIYIGMNRCKKFI